MLFPQSVVPTSDLADASVRKVSALNVGPLRAKLFNCRKQPLSLFCGPGHVDSVSSIVPKIVLRFTLNRVSGSQLFCDFNPVDSSGFLMLLC